MILVLFDVAPQRVSSDKPSIAHWAIEVGLTDGLDKSHFFFGFIFDFLLFCLLFLHCVYLLGMPLVHMAGQNCLSFSRVCTIIAFVRSGFFMFLIIKNDFDH